MKKSILFIFFIFVLIVLRFIFLDTNQKTITKEISIKTSKEEIINKETTSVYTQVDTNKTTTLSNKLYAEIKALLVKAENLLENSKDEEAIQVYNIIIKKTAKTNDPKLLKHFVSACMAQGYIYQVYLDDGNDMAMEAYTMIIDKFEKSNNIEFIQFYIDAKLQLSYLLPANERLEIYNELVSRFEKNSDNKIQEKIESLLISKSFQLMGQDDEEAMQVLDKVIEKYQDRNATAEIPDNIRLSILNNIELALITNNESDTYVELAQKLMSNSSDTKPLLDMLEILKNSQDLDQDEALILWKKEHKGYRFEDWSFQEVERWGNRIEDKETRERVNKYINAFINQKYNIPDKYSDTVGYENTSNSTQTYTDPSTKEPTVNTEEKNKTYPSHDSTEIEEVTEEEIYNDDIAIDDDHSRVNEEIYPDPYENSKSDTYEPDPYVQEIYDPTGEYPNPYE